MSMSQAIRFPANAFCPAPRAEASAQDGEYSVLFGLLAALLAGGGAITLHGLMLLGG